MRYVNGVIGCWALLWVGIAPVAVRGLDVVAVEYVGSTPCDAGTREFLGGLGTNAECHYIRWQLTLVTNQDAAPNFALKARYYVAEKGDTNRSTEGPEVNVRGNWDVTGKPGADRVVHRFTAGPSKRSLAFVEVGENSIHLLNGDGTLAIGTGGWSYTLHRADRAEKLVDPAVARTVPDMSYKISPLATGPEVFGVFEGRTPCHGIAGELKMPQHAGCTKAKWRVTLYQERQTGKPTNYQVEGTLFRKAARKGTWRIAQGAKGDPGATVYELSGMGTAPALRLLKGDDHVLFFLSHEGEPMVGNADFGYTLNRRR